MPSDRPSFRDVVDCYGKDVFRIACWNLNDYNDAALVTQEVFLRVFRHVRKLRKPAALRHWITMITLRECEHLIRDKKTHMRRYGPIEESLDLLDPYSDSERKYRVIEAVDALKKLLPKIQEPGREVLRLFHEEGKTYEEISRILGLPTNTVASHLRMARERLRELLIEEGVEWPL